MAVTSIIEYGTDGVIVPTLIDGYQVSRESRNVVHSIVGRAQPDVTLRPASLRKGTLRLVFGGTSSSSEYVFFDGYITLLDLDATDPEQASKDAFDAHSEPNVFVLRDSTRPTVEMTYVVDGQIGRELDPVTRRVWIVTVDYQEIGS